MRKETEKERGDRLARYHSMSEVELRERVVRFSKELEDTSMSLRETGFKSNSLRHAMMELTRRDLQVDPIVITVQKNRTVTAKRFFITRELDPKRLEQNMLSLLKRAPTKKECPLCEAGIPRRLK